MVLVLILILRFGLFGLLVGICLLVGVCWLAGLVVGYLVWWVCTFWVLWFMFFIWRFSWELWFCSLLRGWYKIGFFWGFWDV